MFLEHFYFILPPRRFLQGCLRGFSLAACSIYLPLWYMYTSWLQHAPLPIPSTTKTTTNRVYMDRENKTLIWANCVRSGRKLTWTTCSSIVSRGTDSPKLLRWLLFLSLLICESSARIFVSRILIPSFLLNSWVGLMTARKLHQRCRICMFCFFLCFLDLRPLPSRPCFIHPPTLTTGPKETLPYILALHLFCSGFVAWVRPNVCLAWTNMHFNTNIIDVWLVVCSLLLRCILTLPLSPMFPAL